MKPGGGGIAGRRRRRNGGARAGRLPWPRRKQVEDTGCFWGRITHGFSDTAENEKQYKRLEENMNQLYHRSHEELEEIKLPVVEQGQICAIYCHELHCWCRAILESLVSSGNDYLAECFLVDYAKHILVKAKDIRRAVDTFWKLPYRVKKFTLFGIQPVTLNINVCEEKAMIGPAIRWDSAAIKYFQKLSQESQTVEAKLKGVTGDTIAVQLYLTLKDVKVCLNDDLVSKMFARYIPPKKQDLARSSSSLALSMKKEIPMKKIIAHGALSLWSEILEGSTFEEQNQGYFGQESVVPCLQGKERSASCELMNKQDSKTPSSSLHSRNSVEPLQAFSLLKKQPDQKIRIDHSKDSHKDGITSILKQTHNEIIQARLLQFLNPDPLNTKSVLHLQQVSSKMAFDQCNGILVHSNIKLTPCSNMEIAPVPLNLKKELCKKNIGPNIVQAYCWPAIGRGCDLVAVSHKGDDPLLYIPPLLTFLQMQSLYNFQSKRNLKMRSPLLLQRTRSPLIPNRSEASTGRMMSPLLLGVQGHCSCLPFVIIVCPGQQKAHYVYQVLIDLKRFSRPLNLSLVLVGQDPEERQKIKLDKGYDVVITTPHSLVRVLKKHCLFFVRLSHLILHEVDLLFNEALDEITCILQQFREATNIPERLSTPQQLIAVGKHWTKEMEILVKQNQNDPYVVITAMEEAALYGNVHQIVQLCQDHEKTSLLLTTLDFTSEILQKTLIFANCPEEVDHVFKALDSNSNFCLKVHEGMSLQLSQVSEQWNNKFSPGTHVILVTTDECLKVLGITDAICVIHYGFPSSQKIFGARLYCMVDNFKNLIVEETCLQCQSIIIMTDRNAPQMVSFLHYLERTEAEIPTELYKFISVLNDKDDDCYDKSLCKYLKAYGICRDIKTCTSRHKVHPSVDKQRCLSDKKSLPSQGYVEIIPTYVSNASRYYGRIIKHRNKWESCPVSMEDDYQRLLKDMAEYYLEEKHRKAVERFEVFALYALKEKTYCRVQLISLSQKYENAMLSNAEVKYIDSGQTGHVMQKQLLELPSNFQVLPPQIVEFIVCRVKPIDHEMDWNPQVSRFIKQKVINISHEAKIVLALGNTLWLNSVVHVTKLHDLSTTILDYNIRSEIINSGFGTDNVEHIERLKALCKAAGIDIPDENSPQKGLCFGKDLKYAVLENNGSYHSVKISEFSTPKCFYLQLITNQEKLGALEDEINQKATEKQDGILNSFMPTLGDICLAFSATKKRWCRVRILSADDSNKNYHVFFVDIGSYGWISLNSIQPLMRDALALPFQAICCSLFGVEPVGKNWNPEIKELIWTIFKDKELQAKVIEQSRNESTNTECYQVDLQDPSNGRFGKLSECIISRGYGRGTSAALNQLFPEKALENDQKSSIPLLCSSVYTLLGDQQSSSLRFTKVKELKNLVLQYSAGDASKSGCLRYLCRLLRFLSAPKEQADIIIAMTHLVKMQERDQDEIREERVIYVLVSLLQGGTDSELQESACIALGILGKKSDLCSSFIDATALKQLCHLLKMPVENKVWQAIIEALAEFLSSNRFCEEIERQKIVEYLCEKIQQPSQDKDLENMLRILYHLSGRAESLNLMLANGLELTINRLLSASSCKSALYKIANKIKFSLTSVQNNAVFSEENNDIMAGKKANQSTTTDHKSFHPEVKWHQNTSVDAKLYLADLELQGSILKDKCSCTMKNKEPVIMLFKEEKGPWSGLLKLKNPNVTFDFNYFEEPIDDGSLPICNDIRRKEHQLVLEPIIDECNSLTNDSDSSEDDY
ncbi:putative ATP-dependent RNA helicase TDRD12 isoform X4 [Narcine bancroftii]|uniref:putative ATP-dependent RNA helicase TDRD12 isoform X4 n=1 Tax=Narcine bancroftii TaxID=1343680 RepID=UPI003831CAD1